jgi:hypothetical protein
MNIFKIFIIFILFLPLSYNLIINIGPTGLLLPYTLGILGYIKHNTYCNKYNSKFIGTSGGSYCSLLYCIENDLSNHNKIWNIFFNNTNSKIYIYKNLNIYQNNLINNLKYKYKNYNINNLPIIIIVNQ